MKRFLKTAVTFVLLAIFIAGCSALGGKPAPKKGGTATVTFTQEPDNLNPLYTQMTYSALLRDLFLRGLWSFDENGKPVPELAKEIPTKENGGISADGKTITVKLRDDVKWSDGEAITSDDFIFTFEMVMSEKNIVQSRYPFGDYVTGVEGPDPKTVVIKFSSPFAPWMTTVFANSGLAVPVLPKHVLKPVFDAKGSIDQAEWNRAPTVGDGPFIFQEWESGSHIIFKANPNWINPPNLDQVFIRIVPDDAAQEAAIIAGDTDIGYFLSAEQIPNIEKGGKVKAVTVLSGYAEALFLNVNPKTAHPAMLDKNVRKAIALATDRFTIVKTLKDPNLNPVNATFWDTNPPFGDTSLKPYPFDPEQAKQLLDAAGWKDTNSDGIREKDGVKLELRYVTNEKDFRKNVQAVVQQQWAQVGIAAKLVNYSSDIFWQGWSDNGPQAIGDYDVAEYSSVGYFPDPEASNNWLCNQVTTEGDHSGINWQGYCNPELDKLLDQQAVTIDMNARTQLYYQIEKIMYDEYIYIGMWADPDIWSVNNRLKGVRFSGASPFWNCYQWYVE